MQERSGVFNFNFGRRDQLFYSRRIGINEGEVQSIIGGARVVGRSGDWDIGAISMQTVTQGEFQGENLSVFRAKRDVINDRSDVGMMLTHRMDFEGDYNFNYGLDANIEVTDDQRLTIRLAQTFDSDINNSFLSPEASKYWISYSTQNRRGFGYGISLSRSGKDFIPGLGFEVRDDYWRIGNRLTYNWFGDEDSKIFSHGFRSGYAIHWSNETGKLESLGGRMGWGLRLKNGWVLETRLQPQIENIIEVFDLSDDVEIPLGDYDFIGYGVEISTPPTKSAFLAFEINRGGFYDGTRTNISISPTFNVSSSLELSASYQYNRASFNQRDQYLTFHLARLKVLVMFSTKLSIASLIQYNNQSKTFLGNLRLRYNPSEGNDLFVVFNDDLNSDRFRERPTLPKTNQRSIQVKYSYTFRL